MSLDWIKTPVTQDEPGGPDLWMDDDPEFSEYYFDAQGRLPEPDDYVKLGLEMGSGGKAEDQIFDPTSVNLPAGLATIDGREHGDDGREHRCDGRPAGGDARRRASRP